MVLEQFQFQILKIHHQVLLLWIETYELKMPEHEKMHSDIIISEEIITDFRQLTVIQQR